MLSKNLIVAASNAGAATYIEDVFSPYLYTGNGSTQTITNGIDLAGEGGMVWIKGRSGATDHQVFDTLRGATYELITNSAAAQAADTDTLTAFNSDGFSLGADATTNTSSATYASWTFRKQAKFFDIVTWTGDGSFPRVISHSLGSVPGCIIFKKTSAPDNWYVWHRSLTAGDRLQLDTDGAAASSGGYITSVTSTTFSPAYNDSGATYVAYLFAHDAGGFGAGDAESIIKCGSFTTDGSGNATVTLGWEPQFAIMKISSSSGDGWKILDNMRGLFASSSGALLKPNTSEQEYAGSFPFYPNATGFTCSSLPLSTTYIYIAIRRPMKTPEAGTEVFAAYKQTFSGTTVTDTGFVVDTVINKTGAATTSNNFVFDRLRGSDNGVNQQTLPSTSSTSAEVASSGRIAFTGSVTIQNGFLEQDTTTNNVVWAFRRSPGFFDMVCYTGTGSATTVTHNLGVTPELMIVKCRSNTNDWAVYYGDNTDYLLLNSTAATADDSTYWNDTSPTSSVFSIGTNTDVNTSSYTYVAYLFATLAGVSKVGSYTGNGSNQTINCGFSAGARFVLIKRTDDIGDWYVWDSARGIVAGDDPHLSLNTTAAEVTTDDTIDPASSGFIVNQLSATNVNVSSATYIYLAIA